MLLGFYAIIAYYHVLFAASEWWLLIWFHTSSSSFARFAASRPRPLVIRPRRLGVTSDTCRWTCGPTLNVSLWYLQLPNTKDKSCVLYIEDILQFKKPTLKVCRSIKTLETVCHRLCGITFNLLPLVIGIVLRGRGVGAGIWSQVSEDCFGGAKSAIRNPIVGKLW